MSLGSDGLEDVIDTNISCTPSTRIDTSLPYTPSLLDHSDEFSSHSPDLDAQHNNYSADLE